MKNSKSISHLTANERRAIKTIFEKQVITLTYIKNIKDVDKKIETSCLLIVDALQNKRGF